MNVAEDDQGNTGISDRIQSHKWMDPSKRRKKAKTPMYKIIKQNKKREKRNPKIRNNLMYLVENTRHNNEKSLAALYHIMPIIFLKRTHMKKKQNVKTISLGTHIIP